MQTAISTFDDYAAAERAVDRLVEAGFPREDVHIEAGSGTPSATATGSTRYEPGRDRGILESIGNFFASLFGQDTPDRDTHAYTEAVRRGHAVVVVDVDDEQESERAVDIMNEMGAVHIDQRSEQWRAAGWNGRAEGVLDDDVIGQRRLDEQEPMPAGGTPGRTDGEGKVMDVVQEELQVGKRQIDRGGVRVVQRVSEKPVRELLKLREERAFVERRNVDRPATQADLENFEDATIEVRESVEEPVVAKSARVVEEVRVGKEVQERTETISDTLRRKDVEVERMEGQPGTERRDMRERAVASDDAAGLRDTTRSERDISNDSRETKDVPTRRDV